jgi:hypothetical protein
MLLCHRFLQLVIALMSLDPFADSLRSPFWGIMFPNAKHAPAETSESVFYPLVSYTVENNLFFPPSGIGGRPGSVFGASMPKASVNEDGKADLFEQYVRTAPAAFDGRMSRKFNPHSLEMKTQLEFGSCACATHCSHPLARGCGGRYRFFGFSEHVFVTMRRDPIFWRCSATASRNPGSNRRLLARARERNPLVAVAERGDNGNFRNSRSP